MGLLSKLFGGVDSSMTWNGWNNRIYKELQENAKDFETPFNEIFESIFTATYFVLDVLIGPKRSKEVRKCIDIDFTEIKFGGLSKLYTLFLSYFVFLFYTNEPLSPVYGKAILKTELTKGLFEVIPAKGHPSTLNANEGPLLEAQHRELAEDFLQSVRSIARIDIEMPKLVEKFSDNLEKVVGLGFERDEFLRDTSYVTRASIEAYQLAVKLTIENLEKKGIHSDNTTVNSEAGQQNIKYGFTINEQSNQRQEQIDRLWQETNEDE